MTAAFEEAFADGPAFIPYLAAGDPGGMDADVDPMEATTQYVEALVDGGADIVELGLPFSEPIADGPTIREATSRALAAGMTPRRFLTLIEELTVEVPLVVMTYFNPVYQYGDSPGVDAFVADAARAGIDGMIVPDLPVEEADDLVRACRAADIALVFIAAPTTRDDRLTRILELVDGYLYVQARLGTTGARADVSDQTRESLERIRRFEEETARDPVPKAVGFGIATGEQACAVIAAGADGIIVGSALVDRLAAADSVDAAAVSLREHARELKAGAIRGLDERTDRPETN